MSGERGALTPLCFSGWKSYTILTAKSGAETPHSEGGTNDWKDLARMDHS
jgi:hypothetical protein